MNSKNPQELIDEVQQEQQTRSEVAKQVLQWFLDGNQQELFPRTEVVEQISGELDLSLERAQLGITDTVGDIVDPVQQVISKQKYVGIIDYKVFADEGAYGYVDYDDRRGNRKRVVCARCVERAQYDEEVVHATQGEGSSSEDASWQQLLNKITSHYANSHTKVPENIEPGASLVNGTTISGNTAFHQGNESSINHDSIGGISANDHHSQNHGNEDHNSNYITNAPVDSVNGQTGAVNIQAGSDVQVFNSDGAWNKPSNGSLVNVIMAGGGGGGGGSDDSTGQGQGGGGGGYAFIRAPKTGLASGVSVVVGQGGSGGSRFGPEAGSSGTKSEFGTLSVGGGVGGSRDNFGEGGAGGSSASGGGAAVQSGSGQDGGSTGGGEINGATYPGPGGGGEGSADTGGFSRYFGNGGDADLNGSFPGGGGGGAQGDSNGGDGADGVVIVVTV